MCVNRDMNVERDTIDKTGTHYGPALTTHFARRAAIPRNLSVQECAFLNGTDFGLPPGVGYDRDVEEHFF